MNNTEYALIKNGVVQNIIVADETFIQLIENEWDECIRVDNLEQRPYMFDLYQDGQFSHPIVEE